MTSKTTKHGIPVLGAILAGGRATRMGGQEKFLLEVGGQRIVDRLKNRLGPLVDKLVLNVNDPDMAEKTGLETLADKNFMGEPIGPMGGLCSVLQYAQDQGFKKILTVPGDTPFIPEDLLSKLSECDGAPIAVTQSKGRLHPLCGLWDVEVITDLKKTIESRNYKMMDWLDSQSVSIVSWHQDPDPFFNINTPEDLGRAEELCLPG